MFNSDSRTELNLILMLNWLEVTNSYYVHSENTKVQSSIPPVGICVVGVIRVDDFLKGKWKLFSGKQGTTTDTRINWLKCSRNITPWQVLVIDWSIIGERFDSVSLSSPHY